jgi:hypothetical protein
MQRGLPAFAGREFRVGVGVGTAITVVVGLIFLFLGASSGDAPALLPSVPLWLGALLAAELSALLVAWGGLAVYFGAAGGAPPGPAHRPLALGLLAGALGGALLVVLFLLLEADASGGSGGRRRRGGAPRG